MDLIHETAYLIVVNLSTVFGNYIQGQISKLEKIFLQSQALERSKKVKVSVLQCRHVTF